MWKRIECARHGHLREVSPKRKEKYLFRGRIWVDAEDYALARAEGQPAKSPTDVNIEYFDYAPNAVHAPDNSVVSAKSC
jgi:outer membrane lipoprotein-sorting protein